MPEHSYDRERAGRDLAAGNLARLERQFEAEHAETGEDLGIIRSRYYAGLSAMSQSTRQIQAIEARIAKLVDEAPPLTDAQVARLQAIFRRVPAARDRAS